MKPFLKHALKDARMFEARVNPAIMESSEQCATYAEVVRSRSIEELTEEMQSRWARNFVDDGGPVRWIDKLTRMGFFNDAAPAEI